MDEGTCTLCAISLVWNITGVSSKSVIYYAHRVAPQIYPSSAQVNSIQLAAPYDSDYLY